MLIGHALSWQIVLGCCWVLVCCNSFAFWSDLEFGRVVHCEQGQPILCKNIPDLELIARALELQNMATRSVLRVLVLSTMFALIALQAKMD